MGRIRIIEPKAVTFTTTIEVPMSKKINIFDSKDLYRWEQTFIALRDTTTTNNKREFEICRAIVKWADQCYASLKKVTNSSDAVGNTLEFTFEFATLERLDYFVNNLCIGL